MPKDDRSAGSQTQEVLPASVADYNSDEGEEVQETRKQANVALKRSKDFSTASPNLTPQASTITPSSYTAGPEASVGTITGAQINPDTTYDSRYVNGRSLTVAGIDPDLAVLDDDYMPNNMGGFDMRSYNMSVGAGSDIHTTTTSSTCDREENGSEVVIEKNGKKFYLCRDPKCKRKHKAPSEEKEKTKGKRADSVTGSSRQSETSRGSAGSPTKSRKSAKVPAREEKEKKRRDVSPKRKEKETERVKEPKPKVVFDERPQLRQRSQSVSDPMRPRGVYRYPVQHPANGPPSSMDPRYRHMMGYIQVNRSYPRGEMPLHPKRPSMQQRATEMSARQIQPGMTFGGRPPPLIREEKASVVLSARKVLKDSQAAQLSFESEEDDEEDYSEDEEEHDYEPTLRDYERVMAANKQERQDLEIARARKQERERGMHERNLEALRMRRQREQEMMDKINMPPPPRPGLAMKVGQMNNHTYSMRQPPPQQRVTHDQLPPLQTRDHLPPHIRSPVLTQQITPMTKEELLLREYHQFDSPASATSARPPINPLLAGKLPSTPVLGTDSSLFYSEPTSARQRRPNSYYGSDISGDWDVQQQYQLMEQRQQQVQAAQVAAMERDRIALEQHMRARELETMGYSVQHPNRPLYNEQEYFRPATPSEAAIRAEANMKEAQRHIASSSSQPHAHDQLEGIFRKPSHSKKASRDSSSTSNADSTRNRRKPSLVSSRNTESTVTAGTATNPGHVFRAKFDPDHDVEFGFADQVMTFKPDEDGKVEVYVTGRREKQYIKSTGTNTSASTGVSSGALGRRMSRREVERRQRFEDEEDEDEDEDEEDESEEETEEEDEVDKAEERRRRMVARNEREELAMLRQREREREREEKERERLRDAKAAERRRAKTSSGSHSGSSGYVEMANERGTPRPRAKTSEAGSGASKESRRGDVKRRG